MSSENVRASKEGFKEKFKTWFNISKDDDVPMGADNNSRPHGTSFGGPSVSKRHGGSVAPSEKLLRDLSSGNDLGIRIKALKSLETIISSRKLDPSSLAAVWGTMEDMLVFPSGDFTVSVESCQIKALKFTNGFVKAQFDQLQYVRPRIFEAVREVYAGRGSYTDTETSEVLDSLIFECMKALTKDGTSVSGFGEKSSQFVLIWTSEVFAGTFGVDVVEFLTMLRVLIRDNSSFWSEEQICDLISQLCIHTGYSKNPKEIEQSLNVVDTILCYSLLPRPMLQMLMTTLCKLVNKELLCGQCWRLARGIFGSHLGNGAMYCLCNLLQVSFYWSFCR